MFTEGFSAGSIRVRNSKIGGFLGKRLGEEYFFTSMILPLTGHAISSPNFAFFG
jgi:hypothetical protein